MRNSRPEILILEDDKALVDALKFGLESEYQIYCADEEEVAISMVEKHRFGLLLVDENLRFGKGLNVIKEALRLHPSLPIFVITAQATKEFVIECLNLGVKKFLQKPFELAELRKSLDGVFEKGYLLEISPGCFLYPDQQLLNLKGESITLTPIEFRILYAILDGKGALVSRTDLLQKVWGNLNLSNNILDTHLSSLRKKHSELSRRLKASRGRGFRWESSL